MNNVKISLIIPVYNSKDYVGAAIESVLKQDFEDFELILVNDGSTDGSEKVCEEYVQKDERVKLINKENGGLCSARNAGIEASKGDYLMFMDNDDELSTKAFSTVWAAVEKYHTDIIRFNRKRVQIFDDNSKKTDIYGCKGICEDGKAHVFTRSEFFGNFKKVRNSGCFAGIWNGAFRRELFKNIRFDTSLKAGGEDYLVNINLYEIFETVVFIPDVLYTYFRRTTHSISTTFEKNLFLANIKCSYAERRLILNAGLPKSEYYHAAMLNIALSVKLMIHKNSNMSLRAKVKLLKKFRKMKCFSFNALDILKSSASLMDKAYLTVFTLRMYRTLILISKIVFDARGNA